MAANKLPPREMLKRWDEARPIFVTAIAKAIDKKTRNNRRWVDQSGLIPVGVKASKFAAIFKKGLTPHVGGAFKCDLVDDNANLIMIRHAFGNKRYLWVGAKGTTDEEVLEAIRKYPKENARNESIASEFHQVCEDELVELCGMERQRGAEISATTPTITRRQERRNAVVNAPSPADQLETYPRHQQRRIVDDLAADAKRKDELEAILDRIEDEPAAADVIDFMMSQDDVADGAPMKLIQSILARPSVRRTGHLLPRTESFAEAGERNQQNAVRILNAMMNKCAKLLLPNDGKEGRYLLIDAMIKSPIFRKYSLPSRKTNNELKYRQFATSPSVLAIKEAMETLGRSNENLRVQLLSVLKAYPMRWIQKLIPGVGRTTAGKGKFHAQVVGAGLSDEMAPNIVRNRRRGAVEEHFQGWLVENMIVLPNVNKDSNGRHVDAPITYLRQNRHQSLQSYRKDFEIAKSEGKFNLTNRHSAYGSTHVYKRFNEMNLREAPEQHAICSHCNRNDNNWSRIAQAIDVLFGTDSEMRRELTSKVEKFRAYFMSGGKFTVQLQVTSSCIHHCCRYALSDLDDADFQDVCTGHHEHSHGDEMVESAHDLFDLLRGRWRQKYQDTNFQCNHDGDAVTVIYIRGDEAKIRDNDGEDFIVSWEELEGLPPSKVNILLLGDLIDVFEERFVSHLGHLYTDRIQTYGKHKICARKKNVMTADYLMKLRAKKRSSDQSEWHLLQVKGSSVHIACLEHQLDQEEIEKLVEDGLISAFDEVEEQDLLQTHVIAFGSDTTQGGYETLSTLVATIARFEKEDPGLFDEEGLYVISDAGSGYRTKENIAGLRGKKVLGYLFSCPGHGKTTQCDGKGPQIKAQRERAMRAGEPADCTTPRREVLAQMYDGGLPGTVSELIEISPEERMQMQQWDGLMSYLYFEYLGDGGIQVWRYYGIGPGKTFSKEWLDSLYVDAIVEEENEGSGDSSDAEDDGEDSDDEVETYTDVDGEERTWYRWALKYQNQRIAKRGLDDKKEDIYLGTTVGSGYVGDKRKVTVRFDEQVVDYISDGDDDGDDDKKVADGYLEDMDEKELRRNFALYKSEGIRRERSSSVARGPRSPSQADEASTSVAASSALSYPQAQTGGRFVEVKVGEYGPNPRSDDEDDTDSEEEAEPRDVKVMSAKKKRKLDKEARAARVERGREERRQKLLHKEKERDERAKKVWPLKCSECERRFKGQHFMDQHVCHPSRAVSSSVVVGPNASLYAGRTGSDRSAPTLLTFENVKPLGSRSWRRLLMGHGISWGRESNPMNPAARKILVACFELGEQRGGGKRMSPYEMQQACLAELPSLICPEIQEIQRFISDQVNSRKKGESGDVEGGDGDNNGDGNNNAGPTIRRKFSRAEKEQKRAAVLKNELFQLRADNSDLVEMRFNKKYVGKFLMQEKDSGDVRIVMDVKYCREQHLWYAETVEAEVDEIDDRKYSPLDNGTILNVYVGRGSTNLSKYIKQYNQWAELSK